MLDHYNYQPFGLGISPYTCIYASQQSTALSYISIGIHPTDCAHSLLQLGLIPFTLPHNRLALTRPRRHLQVDYASLLDPRLVLLRGWQTLQLSVS